MRENQRLSIPRGRTRPFSRWVMLGCVCSIIPLEQLTGDASFGVRLASAQEAATTDPLDAALAARLRQLGFTGSLQASREERLGRPLDPELFELGRLLWFDSITSLGNDNS